MIGEAFDAALFAWLVIAWFCAFAFGLCLSLLCAATLWAALVSPPAVSKAPTANRRALRAVPPPPVAPRSNRKVTP